MFLILRSFLFVIAWLCLTNCANAPHADSASQVPVLNIKPVVSVIPAQKLKGRNVADFLPYGFVKDGTVDYTFFIQEALNRYDELVFPGFPLLINDTGLTIGSNKTIYFLPGSELRMKPSANSNYNILLLKKVNNVTLINPVLRGDRYTHLNNSGEWGMGIGIFGSTNITIKSPQAYECWGDGIYIGDSKGIVSKNIRISNAYCKYNRRDGITITSVDGLVLESPYAGFTDGTLPKTGINFEPNSSRDELRNIVVNNPVTERNGGQGIQIGFDNLYGDKDKVISFQIKKHIDHNSNVGFYTSCYDTKKKKGETIKGTINLTGPFWKYNTTRPIQTALFGKDLKLVITKPKVQDQAGKILAQGATKELMTYKRNINRDAFYQIIF